jgi:hypothetical protein
MTLALPNSWTTQKQALWMEQHWSSEKVASAIHAEWQRRQMDNKERAALFVQPQQQQQRQQGDEGIWCDCHKSETYTNAHCAAQGGARPPSFFQKRKGKANTAQTVSQSLLQQTTALTASAQLTNIDDNSDGSAFNTYIDCESSNNQFIIDSGASHHMVNSASLLANIQPLSPVKQIRIGDGTHLAAVAVPLPLVRSKLGIQPLQTLC